MLEGLIYAEATFLWLRWHDEKEMREKKEKKRVGGERGGVKPWDQKCHRHQHLHVIIVWGDENGNFYLLINTKITVGFVRLKK